MKTRIDSLLTDIRASRHKIVELVAGVSAGQGSLRVEPDRWNIQEVIEHLVLAERGGFDLIFTAAERYRTGNPVWSGPSENEGLTIEAIVKKTWKPKEQAPESATPTGKWTLGVWLSHFMNCDDLLHHLRAPLENLPLDEVIYPHFLCGPLNAHQRLEFIRFHIDRHYAQIAEIKKELVK
ncbi:DinB family protein [Robiginitalea marina]|uniref:DinB family protein n=1 Tax=Robiginitalea marina TaxID=2954105 RepID=A0ABT1AWD9_9FLAO|nr:DinB family protein [Robiginitalea marina]MCO5723890.1 DinB family protein [Robiginitalea marina]